MNNLARLPVTSHQAGSVTDAAAHIVPALIAAAGERASLRFLEFFAANIRNPHTRRAYGRAVAEFLAWCDDNQVRSIDGRAAASRRRLDRDAAAASMRHRPSSAPRGAAPSVRLAGDGPGHAGEPGRIGARPVARR